jgi:hypothetical protein
MLAENEVNVGIKPLDDYHAGIDVGESVVEGVEGNDEVEPEFEEIGEPKGEAIRSANYTELEDLHLIIENFVWS